MSVVEIRPKLKLGEYSLCTDASFGNVYQAWTTENLERALAAPDYFQTMHDSVEPGDTVELFQINAKDIGAPAPSPLAIAAVAITKKEVDRTGKHVRFMRTGELLYFDGTPGLGLRVAQWNRQWFAYDDNRRIAGPFRLKLEAKEVFTHTLSQKYGISVTTNNHVMQNGKELGDLKSVFEPDYGLRTHERALAKCKPDDIARAGNWGTGRQAARSSSGADTVSL